MLNDSGIREILGLTAIAVVGCSPKEGRPSFTVSFYLKSVGYKIIPVRPGYETILGEKCYPNLLEIPEKVEIVNIFRRSEHVFPIAQDAIKIGAKVIWMQDGIEHFLAAQIAQEAGLKVVMNDCLMREHIRLSGPYRKTITTC